MQIQESNQLNPANNLYYHADIEGNIFPLDPIKYSRMVPHGLPESLAADPELSGGYEFLRDNAHRIYFSLLRTAHGNADDLKNSGIDLHAEAKMLAQNNGILFLENVNTVEGQEREEKSYNQVSRWDAQPTEKFREDLDRQRGEYTHFATETIYQIAGTGVDVAIPDYRIDASGPERALANWRRKLDILESTGADNTPKQRSALYDQWQSSYLGFVAYRDWYLMAKMGVRLRDRYTSPDAMIHAALLAGPTHEFIGVELEELGATVQYKGEQIGGLSTHNILIKSIGRASLSADDRLHMLHAHLFEDAHHQQAG